MWRSLFFALLLPLLTWPHHVAAPAEQSVARFEAIQPQLFAAPGAQPNAWADFDNDGDLDLFVGFRGGPNRLYRNDRGRFVEIAAHVGLADTIETRAAAWGDFDLDGHMDLYIGFPANSPVPNRLYRNEGDGRRFTDVAARAGVAVRGTTRQVSWIDYDNDGDVDLFIAFRDRPNMLLRNGGGRFTDVAPVLGLDDPRKTVGVVWFDMDQDGDLDVFVANQDGDANGFFRNDGDRFVDVADGLGVSEAGRPGDQGGVGPSVADYDNDGDFDLFVANYGPDAMYRNDGDRWVNVGAELGLSGDYHSTTSAWGDFDNDGRIDLYVASYYAGQRDARDRLFWNQSYGFIDVLPELIRRNDASHGVQWADFDSDGALDLSLANNHASGSHYLYRNLLPPEQAARSLKVMILNAEGRHSRAGTEVRLYVAGSRTLLGTRLVDSGGGYASQSAAPVHFGLPALGLVDVEVTVMGPRGREITMERGVDPRRPSGGTLVLRR